MLVIFLLQIGAPSPAAMPKSGLDLTVSTANLVALLAVLVTLITFVISARKDRHLKRTQYADQIRSAAALLTAKLERWRDLAEGLFDEIQPAITQADMLIVKEHDIVSVRDNFWRDLWVARASVLTKISDEQIEVAYATLYAYDVKARELFLATIQHLKMKTEIMYDQLFDSTQGDIFHFKKKRPLSAELGNRLRNTASIIGEDYKKQMLEILQPFQREMIKLIEADDESIVQRAVPLKQAQEIYHAPIQAAEKTRWQWQINATDSQTHE